MLNILSGDALAILKTLPDESVQCCVTSPPYWGLRDYGVAGQLGLEPTPEEFVARLVSIFREVRRVLKIDGTCWVNMGDSYAASGRGGNPVNSPHQKQRTNRGSVLPAGFHENQRKSGAVGRAWVKPAPGYKPKDLVGIPWMVAFSLRSDGWYLRQDIIWSKPNPMPESVTDRCTKSHEYIFLLSKSQRYFYDAAAIQEGLAASSRTRLEQPNIDFQKGSERVPGKTNGTMKAVGGGRKRGISPRHEHLSTNNLSLDAHGRGEGRNKRSVWNVATVPFSEAHFATYPPALITPCILAGTRPGDMVLDPFGGSGTTGQVALELGRQATLIELNPEYVKLIKKRCTVTMGLALEGSKAA